MDQMAEGRYRWYRELNGYQWFVLIVASLGWMLDCFDQQLFMMARQPAMTELLVSDDALTPFARLGTYFGRQASVPEDPSERQPMVRRDDGRFDAVACHHQRVRRICGVDLSDGLGHWRVDLRRDGRSHRPREDHDHYDPDVLPLHRAQRDAARLFGTSLAIDF